MNGDRADDIRPWMALAATPGIGPHLFRRLLRRFGTPADVLRAPREDLLRVEGMGPRLVDRLRRQAVTADQAKELAALARLGGRLVTQADPAYPPLLLEIPDPPPFLYVQGQLPAGGLPAVAVVGSRNATPYGLETTVRLCRDLAAAGVAVVSGLARGIDTAAHEGALQGGGLTLAVLGSGLGHIYPVENRPLAARIAQKGAVISELPLAAGPDAHHFPRRNRIISGMSLGTVVVEATRRSGSLITARLALEQNREVFAVPGSVNSFKSMGTHALIQEGAKLVTHVGDILEEIGRPAAGAAPAAHGGHPAALPHPLPGLPPEEQAIVAALGPYPVHIDHLVRQLGLAPGLLAGILLRLELKGFVQQHPGDHYSQTARCLEDR